MNDNNDSDEVFLSSATEQKDDHSKETGIQHNSCSHSKTVSTDSLSSSGNDFQSIPDINEFVEQSMFSSKLMKEIFVDLNNLNEKSSLTRRFQSLYHQSYLFNVYQSYIQYSHLIHYVYEITQIEEEEEPDLSKFLSEFNSYDDLRTCECIDDVMTVYGKLIKYHTILYDMYEKIVDEKRHNIRLKQFDRIMYYRIEVCQLLLRVNCLRLLFFEIQNGKKFIQKVQTETNTQSDPVFQFRYFYLKYVYHFFQAAFLQRTKDFQAAKQLCEQSLKELNQAYQQKIWNILILKADSSENDKQQSLKPHTDNQSNEDFDGFDHPSTAATKSETFTVYNGTFRLDYLLCQYNLLQFELSRHQSSDSIKSLMDFKYYRFPLSFSIPCTISLVEYFYCKMDYEQCLRLIDKIIRLWWSYVSPREKLEFAKLKCLSLIIELTQGSLDSSLSSGYFAKRVLTGYHENIFLIQSSIHLTLSLIGQMRMTNIQLILQHFEYLSEQSTNFYTKLWYYILIIDVALELGYQLIKITVQLIDNIQIYRTKLLPGSNERSLTLFYCDCISAQIYARLGILDKSKIHFHYALYSIKFDQNNLSNIDFRFKRALLKLVETQLLHWYHTKQYQQFLTQDLFLLDHLDQFNNEQVVSWNKTRFIIYQAYYKRLINHHTQQTNFNNHNDFSWETSLLEGEKHAIKLDLEWIKRLRNAWLHPLSEQIESEKKPLTIAGKSGRSASVITKPNNRRIIRKAVPSLNHSMNETITGKEFDEESQPNENSTHQKFIDWRSSIKNNNSSQFQLYILPVRM